MNAAISIDVLPADRGDSLWIECRRPGRPWRLLFDGGMPETAQLLRDRIAGLDPADRVIDLAVVSHIDADHIGGMLPLIAAMDLGVTFGDIWFNGLPQLPDDRAGQGRSVRQGESLVELLSGAGGAPERPWNAAFQGRAVTTGDDGRFVEVTQEGWPAITVLSPTRKRLVALRKSWVRELDLLKRGQPEEPERPLAPLEPLQDLRKLAETETPNDTSVANGSSIAFLLEHQGASCLLAADAFVTVLGAALISLANERGGRPIDIDVFKLSHHGSQGNLTVKLLQLVPARHYVVSTNGERFGHPDDVALARILTSAAPGLTLWFNYANHANERWGDAGLRGRYGHSVQYPRDGSAGVRLELPARDRGRA